MPHSNLVGKHRANPQRVGDGPLQPRRGTLTTVRYRSNIAKALKDSKVAPFVLSSLRHTFLTRLGASHCDVWTSCGLQATPRFPFQADPCIPMQIRLTGLSPR